MKAISRKSAHSATAEHIRLAEDAQSLRNWKRGGPYLSERQWRTVREDYSPQGNAWEYLSHDTARRGRKPFAPSSPALIRSPRTVILGSVAGIKNVMTMAA